MVCVLCVPYAVCIHVGALGLAVCYMFCKLSTLHVLMCVMYACGQFLYMCAFCAHEAVLGAGCVQRWTPRSSLSCASSRGRGDLEVRDLCPPRGRVLGELCTHGQEGVGPQVEYVRVCHSGRTFGRVGM